MADDEYYSPPSDLVQMGGGDDEDEYYDPPSDLVAKAVPMKGGSREDDARRLHRETFGSDIDAKYLRKQTYPTDAEAAWLLHKSVSDTVEVQPVYDVTSDGRLAGMCIVAAQKEPESGQYIVNIWSVAKNFEIRVTRVFERMIQTITELYPTFHMLVLSADMFGTITMTERGRILYYSSLGFRVVEGQRVAVCRNLMPVITGAQDTNGFVTATSDGRTFGRVYVGALTGTVYGNPIKMYATRETLAIPVVLAHKQYNNGVLLRDGTVRDMPLVRNNFSDVVPPENLYVYGVGYHGAVSVDPSGILDTTVIPPNVTVMHLTSVGSSVDKNLVQFLTRICERINLESYKWMVKKFKGYETFPLHAVPENPDVDYGERFVAFHERLGRRRQIDVCEPLAGYPSYQMDVQMYAPGMTCPNVHMGYRLTGDRSARDDTGFAGVHYSSPGAPDYRPYAFFNEGSTRNYGQYVHTKLDAYVANLRRFVPADKHLVVVLASCFIVMDPVNEPYTSKFYSYSHNGSMRYAVPSLTQLPNYFLAPDTVPTGLMDKCGGRLISPQEAQRIRYAEIYDVGPVDRILARQPAPVPVPEVPVPVPVPVPVSVPVAEHPLSTDPFYATLSNEVAGVIWASQQPGTDFDKWKVENAQNIKAFMLAFLTYANERWRRQLREGDDITEEGFKRWLQSNAPNALFRFSIKQQLFIDPTLLRIYGEFVIHIGRSDLHVEGEPPANYRMIVDWVRDNEERFKERYGEFIEFVIPKLAPGIEFKAWLDDPKIKFSMFNDFLAYEAEQVPSEPHPGSSEETLMRSRLRLAELIQQEHPDWDADQVAEEIERATKEQERAVAERKAVEDTRAFEEGILRRQEEARLAYEKELPPLPPTPLRLGKNVRLVKQVRPGQPVTVLGSLSSQRSALNEQLNRGARSGVDQKTLQDIAKRLLEIDVEIKKERARIEKEAKRLPPATAGGSNVSSSHRRLLSGPRRTVRRFSSSSKRGRTHRQLKSHS